MWAYSKQKGFTIVELLIVVVVIGILAAIVIVAYNGVTNNANDSSVQSDLSKIGKKIQGFYSTYGRWPQGTTDLTSLNLKLSKNAYARGYDNGTSWYNFVYCWPSTTSQDIFAIIAESASGNVFENRNGNVRQAAFALAGSVGTCANAGVTLETSGSRDWFYSNDAWLSYTGS